MNKVLQYGGIAVVFLLGSVLLTSRADRIFISLPPTPGINYTTTLTSDTAYVQEFIVHQTSLSRVGFYIRPVSSTATNGTVTIAILRGDTVIGEGSVPAIAASEGIPSAVRFTPPLAITSGETLQAAITISPELSGRVGLQTRAQDETFNRDAVFSINGNKQPNPLAYEAYYSIRPAIPLYIGGLLILGAALLLTHSASMRRTTIYTLYAVGIVLVASIPLFQHATSAVYLLLIIQILLVWCFIRFLPATISLPAKLLGAHTIAFSTWWILAMVAHKPAFGIFIPSSVTFWKDMLLDPNQIALPFAGAYIGIPIAILAMIGYASVLRLTRDSTLRTLTRIMIGLLLVGIAVLPLLVAVSMSIAAAIGLSHIHHFIGRYNSHAYIVIYVLVYCIALDTFAIYSRLIEAAL